MIDYEANRPLFIIISSVLVNVLLQRVLTYLDLSKMTVMLIGISVSCSVCLMLYKFTPER